MSSSRVPRQAAPRGVAPPAAPAREAAPHGRPRLCIVGPMLGRHPGVVTTQGELLADALAAAGHDVTRASDHPARLGRLVDIARTVLRARGRAEVLVVQTFGGPSFVVEDVASLLGRWGGMRIVFHLHGGAMPAFMQRHPRWTRRVLRRGDALVAPSAFLADAVRAHGFEARVIPNGIALADYPFRARTRLAPRLFWMRTFHPLYNPTLAVRVLARVRETHPDATLTMAGQEKGSGDAVRAEVARLGLGDAVRFVGFLDHAGKLAHGDAADVFLNTNHVDNTPVGVLEAAALGLPVVATDVGGLRHLVRHEESALLVADDDAEGMAAAVRRLLDEPALAERLSRNGRAVAERSAWGGVVAAWDALFATLTGAAVPTDASRPTEVAVPTDALPARRRADDVPALAVAGSPAAHYGLGDA